jgi:large subunit ribosomal protein L25
MSGQAIEVKARQAFGTNANRRLRKEGLIPGIVYGQNKETISIAVDPRRIEEILGSASGSNTIFRLQMTEGEQEFKLDMMLRDVQIDPVTDELLHVDFLRLDMSAAIQVKVPVELQGTAPGVKEQGGRMEFVHREMLIECMPGDIPDSIPVDISEMEIGDAVRVQDLDLDEKLTSLDSETMVLVVLNAPRAVEEEEPEEELAEGEEPAAEGEEEKEKAEGAAADEGEEKKG